MLKIKEKWKNLTELLLLEIAMVIIQVFPRFFIVRLSSFLTGKIQKTTVRRAEIVRKNLKLAFPEKTEQDRKDLLNKVYYHFLWMIVDLVKIWKWRKRSSILRKVEIVGQENIDQFQEKKIIFFSAHFGNWELIPLVLSELLDRKIVSVARPAKNSFIERKIKLIRSWLGSEIIEKKNAIIKIVNALKEKKPVFALVDQHAIGKEATLIKFFGLPARTNSSLARLKLKTFTSRKEELLLIPVFLYQISDKLSRFEILPPVDFQPTGKTEDDIIELTQKINEIIELKIREYPEQWFWFHDRWKDDVQEALQ